MIRPTRVLRSERLVLHLRTGADTVDERGEPAAAEVDDREVRGAVQQVGTSEVGGRGGPLVNAEWRLFLHPDVGGDLDAGDAVTLVRTGQRFEVDGDPYSVLDPRSGRISHVEAKLERKG